MVLEDFLGKKAPLHTTKDRGTNEVVRKYSRYDTGDLLLGHV
jgi:hypothetical protein